MLHRLILIAGLCLGAPAAFAQDQTLADIRQSLAGLYVEIQTLRTELSTTGGLDTGVSGSTPLDRLNAIEGELQRLTSKSEQLEFRINRITTDGTNRIGDLEFRLCELETGCDIADLGDTPSLGGVDSGAQVPVADAPTGPSLAVGEAQDFERAQEALSAGDFRAAADQLHAFAATYPGSPIADQAAYLRGEALEGLGEMANAARAYLGAFEANPTGPKAPDSLFKLGYALGVLGQNQDACVTLGEVGVRFPDAPATADATGLMQSLGCS